MRCKRCSQPKTESVCLHIAKSICMCMCPYVHTSIQISYIYTCIHVCEHTMLCTIYIHIHLCMYLLANDHVKCGSKEKKKHATSFVAKSPWTQQACILADARKKLIHVTQIRVVEATLSRKPCQAEVFFRRMCCAAVRLLQIHLSFWWFGHLNKAAVKKETCYGGESFSLFASLPPTWRPRPTNCSGPPTTAKEEQITQMAIASHTRFECVSDRTACLQVWIQFDGDHLVMFDKFSQVKLTIARVHQCVSDHPCVLMPAALVRSCQHGLDKTMSCWAVGATGTEWRLARKMKIPICTCYIYIYV